MLASQYYEKEVTCPVCLTNFQAVAIKNNKCIPAGKDEDFRYIYTDVVPYFYDVWVCPSCHYASPKSIFLTPNSDEIIAIAEVLSKSKLKLNPLGEREARDALTCYKLALLCMSFRKVPSSTIAGVCLKTAWIYRTIRDKICEEEYLNKAIKYYKEAYSNERFPIGGMTEVKLAYILGELSRRVKDYQDAIHWFSKAVSHPHANMEPAILKMARDQWAQTKNEYDQAKQLESATTAISG